MLAPIVPAIKKHDRDLADQMKRAATSVVLDVNEGRRRGGGDQRRSFEIASGSAHEVPAAIDTAIAWGWIDDLAVARQLLDRLLAMLRRLTHGSRRAVMSVQESDLRTRFRRVSVTSHHGSVRS